MASLLIQEIAAPASSGPSLASRRRISRRVLAWWFAALALVVVAAGIVVIRQSGASKVPQYTTARVDRGDITSSVTTSGNLNAVNTVQVGSQVSGNIIALYADFNTKVSRGQLVAEIDPAPFWASVNQSRAILTAAKAGVVSANAALAKAQSDVASAEANIASQKANFVKAQSTVDLARTQNERRKTMVTTGSISQEEADTAQATYDQAVASLTAAQAAVVAAEANADSARKAVDVARTGIDGANALVAQDEAALSQAELNLSHTRILAPVDGTVESRNMDVGQTVAASFQAPVIFLIARDLTKMQVDTNVDESDMGAIRTGQPATFTVDAYAGRIFNGAVAQIRQAPINVQNVITYDVVVAVSNEDLRLLPGMTANVTISTGHSANVLRVPKSALRFRPRGATPQKAATVYVADQNGQPQPVIVTTGLMDAARVEITGGNLAEGTQVITGAASGSASPSSSSQPRGGANSKRIGF